jgi:ABC-2 type transport system permease protein
MSTPLFRAMIKTNGKLILFMAIGSFLFVILTAWIFPMMNMEEMNQLLKMLPKGFLKAFGMETGIQNLNGLLATKHYSMIYIILLIIYSVQTATQLVAHLVDRGSMGYLLSTPISRLKIIITQAVFLLTGLFFICLLNTLGGILGNAWFLKKSSLNLATFLELNTVGFLLFTVICGYSLLFSCLFNDERRALSFSTGLTIIFFSLDLLGKMDGSLEWIRKISIFSTFEPSKIIQGSVELIPIYTGLLIAATILFSISFWVFKRKDLPL